MAGMNLPRKNWLVWMKLYYMFLSTFHTWPIKNLYVSDLKAASSPLADTLVDFEFIDDYSYFV